MGIKNMTNMPVLPREPRSLDELHQMIEEAEEQGKGMSSVREVVYIAGAWMIDEGAQIWKLAFEMDVSIKDRYPEVPMYLTESELNQFLAKHGSKQSLNMTFELSIPTSREVCYSCARGWSLKNIHDVFVGMEQKEISLDQYAGLNLERIRSQLAADLGHNRVKMVRLLQVSEGAANCHLSDEGTIEVGDSAECEISDFYHRDCYRKMIREANEKITRRWFEEAGFVIEKVEAISNRYFSAVRRPPWFRVYTSQGVFVIGRRSEDYYLELVYGVALDFRKIFFDQKMEIQHNFLHIDSELKIVDYLKRIREAIIPIMATIFGSG